MTGIFTFRRRLSELALAHIRNANASAEETRMMLSLGSEVLAADVTRGEAAGMVRERAIEALVALLERGSGYPQALVVCSPLSVAIDAGNGAVVQLIARPDRSGMSVEIRVSEGAARRIRDDDDG